jgi:hypothetical protein
MLPLCAQRKQQTTEAAGRAAGICCSSGSAEVGLARVDQRPTRSGLA